MSVALTRLKHLSDDDKLKLFLRTPLFLKFIKNHKNLNHNILKEVVLKWKNSALTHLEDNCITNENDILDILSHLNLTQKTINLFVLKIDNSCLSHESQLKFFTKRGFIYSKDSLEINNIIGENKVWKYLTIELFEYFVSKESENEKCWFGPTPLKMIKLLNPNDLFKIKENDLFKLCIHSLIDHEEESIKNRLKLIFNSDIVLSYGFQAYIFNYMSLETNYLKFVKNLNIDIVKNIIMYKNPIKILEYNNFFNNNEEVIKDEYLNKAIDSVLLNKNDMKE